MSTESDDAQQTPRPTPRPAAPSPARLPRPTAETTPVAPSAESIAEAKAHGRADADGTVYVVVDGEEQEVGAYPDATPDEALTYFAKKFVELETQVSLLETRLGRGASAHDASSSARSLREALARRGVVGDLAGLEHRLDALDASAAELAEAEKEEAAQARASALAEREKIVKAAEEVASQDPETTHWKNSSSRMTDLFDAWKSVQRKQRLPKSQEDGLWKRFRNARTTFDKHRRAHFSQMDKDNAQAKRVKEGLISEAVALQTSTDWGETAGKYRDLMDRWKRAPRASRKEDDALWNRFRAAQDAFFDARSAAQAETDEEFRKNLQVKEELLVRARAVLPVGDVEKAKAELAPILEAWDEAGMVPRHDLRRVESELQKVQNAVADAEQRKWEESNPETQARADSMLSQLEETISGLERDLAEAEASGNARRADKAREALEARRSWYEQVKSSLG